MFDQVPSELDEVDDQLHVPTAFTYAKDAALGVRALRAEVAVLMVLVGTISSGRLSPAVPQYLATDEQDQPQSQERYGNSGISRHIREKTAEFLLRLAELFGGRNR